jgi:hypothetical protein
MLMTDIARYRGGSFSPVMATDDFMMTGPGSAYTKTPHGVKCSLP